jgi:hypothetical protein
MPSEGWQAGANIYRHIQNTALKNAHEFGFCRLTFLKV